MLASRQVLAPNLERYFFSAKFANKEYPSLSRLPTLYLWSAKHELTMSVPPHILKIKRKRDDDAPVTFLRELPPSLLTWNRTNASNRV
jgi:hypothetical protein